jgi:hypothetical protein
MLDVAIPIAQFYDAAPAPGPYTRFCSDKYLHVGDGYITEPDPLANPNYEYRSVVSLRMFAFQDRNAVGACHTITKYRKHATGRFVICAAYGN